MMVLFKYKPKRKPVLITMRRLIFFWSRLQLWMSAYTRLEIPNFIIMDSGRHYSVDEASVFASPCK